jgi:hypothetical protein
LADNRRPQFPLASVDVKLFYLFPLLRWRLLNATAELSCNKISLKATKKTCVLARPGGRQCL